MDSLSPAFRNAGFWTGLFLAPETLLFGATGAAYDDEFFVSHFSSFCFSLGPYEYANKIINSISFLQAGAFQEFYVGPDPKKDSTGNFILPAYANPMHATPTMYGPLKTDITNACPADLPKSERDEKCKSILILQLTTILDAHSKLVICAGFSLIEAYSEVKGSMS